MTTSDALIARTGKNIQEKATLIWNVANTLFGAFKPHEYGLVILPMVVVKRFHDCLLPTHQAVLDTYKKVEHLAVKEGFLRTAAGYQFYNTSPFTFETLRADPENINDNFRAYLNGFSDNVQDILSRMNFSAQIDRMEEAGLLYQVIVDFCSDKADMGPEKISAVDMGYIFENLVQRFSESYNEEAGAHFTSRDIIYLMCDLLVTGDQNAFNGDGITKTVYDMTMGTSQMLTCMEERLKQLDADADVTCFGQELNPFTFGIAKADMLIRGGDPDNMQFGDTLDDDKFDGYQFDYCISNPPFGIDWKREAAAVEAEHKKGSAGRFGPGLPSKSDGQMLFLLNGLSKLKPEGRMAIIQNGSSLFTGDAGSGQSEIRRYLIENDWLDAIAQLPNDSFYNTGIATYIWIITKDKPSEHIGKVQLIDASKCYESRRKSIGNKRVDITEACRDLIVKAYGEYRDNTYEQNLASGASIVCKSRVLDSIALGYNKITVESPLLDEEGNKVLKKGMYYLELATGLRRGELLGLKWQDVDFNQGTITVRRQVSRIDGKVVEAPLKTKNAYRVIPLGEQALAVLQSQQEKTHSEYVFPSPNGGPISPDSVRNMLRRVLKRAGLPYVRFHDLRHTFATLALQNGVDVKTVSSILGHFSAGFTLDTYAHVTTTAQREAAKKMDGVLGQRMP